ncbi:MAG: energy-coupling factor ABC transporter ATP-binding protein [Desulfovibrionaceae bacterium]|nr:energy-coupling factor ABC transporter ATP-binding protein [Desulfovibrionaceae bacterium]MDD4951672.1 energy-coupling factor ABC transporter ATP-binding protein [Desulfovibrionaceae bacterium]
MIRISDLSFAYPGGPTVLDRVSLGLEKGAILGLAGANASGKSTLLGLLAGLFSPDQGHIRVAGLASPGRERELRRVCRLVVQDADLQIIGSTVAEDLLLGRDEKDPDQAARARDAAQRFGLAEYWDRPVHTLSWGLKRKLCLAAALWDGPRVLLLDEPFSGLDYPGVLEMRRLLLAGRGQGLTQVVATHDLEPLADIADHLAVLDRGRLVLFGAPNEIMDRVGEHGVRPTCSWRAGLGITPWDDGDGR